MKAIVSLLLCVIFLLSPIGASAADVHWADIEYIHYDPAGFYGDVDRLAALASGSDSQAVIELYDRLYEQFARIDTLSAIAYIQTSRDLTDEYWAGESQYADNLRYDTADALSTACHAVTQGPCAEDFAAHVGANAFDAFVEYVPMTDREAELLARETELVDEYNARMNEIDQVTFDYWGQSWDLEMLNGLEGQSLVYQDYNAYLDVYYGVQNAVNQLVGPLYTELVQLRAELAQIEGYDNYAALAYEDVFGRDYSTQDAQMFCDAVKPVARQYYEQLYNSSLLYDTDAVSPVLSPEDILALVGDYAVRLDPTLAEPFRYMTEHGLYDLAFGGDRFPGSYTVTLGQYDSAFIFANLGSSYDGLSTLCHEFGHFVNEYRCPVGNLLTDVPSYDLLEIHSTGLDALFTCFYGEIFDAGTDVARFNVLAALIDALVEGCIYDEFQRRVYDAPDMALDEMNHLYASVSAEYGQPQLRDVDYAWVYVSHTFEMPLYYLSYAASALAAIQIWDLAQTDLAAAVDAWEAVMSHDANTEGYMAVLPACGLRLFTEQGAVDDVCRPLLEELTRLNAG